MGTEATAADEHDNDVDAAASPLASADAVSTAAGDADVGDSYDDAEDADGAADGTVTPLADAGRMRSARRATHAANFGALLNATPDTQAEYFLKASRRCSSQLARPPPSGLPTIRVRSSLSAFVRMRHASTACQTQSVPARVCPPALSFLPPVVHLCARRRLEGRARA